ncbi:hypothetical protein, partial [Yersinia aleksiciae]|uniref:hypothetical protein n=1 Tax=Yersinia aleksiciae TaxID=263819 RepID=UPI001C9428F6
PVSRRFAACFLVFLAEYRRIGIPLNAHTFYQMTLWASVSLFRIWLWAVACLTPASSGYFTCDNNAS